MLDSNSPKEVTFVVIFGVISLSILTPSRIISKWFNSAFTKLITLLCFSAGILALIGSRWRSSIFLSVFEKFESPFAACSSASKSKSVTPPRAETTTTLVSF